jgi:malonyl-CoA/methylmalonyl-CoA synthetase
MSRSFFALLQTRYPADMNRVLLDTDDGQRFTWTDLERITARYAAFLHGLGLAKGDRVAVQVEKSPQAMFLYLACLRAGLIFLPLNTAYTEEEVDYLVGNAEPGLVVCRPEAEAASHAVARRHGVRHVLTLDGAGHGTFINGAAAAPSEFAPVACDDDDIAAILYTSGTTGKPKGAMLSHRNLAANAIDLVATWGFRGDDVLLHALPIFHAHGLFVACNCTLLSTARMIWLAKFDAPTVLSLLPNSTVFMGVPTFYTRLLQEPGLTPDQCAHMRLFISGSAPLLEETHRAFAEKTGQMILERYGMTETGMNTSNPLMGERRGGTVGFPLPSTGLRIAGEDGSALGREEVGIIQVKGANVFSGYWRMPDKTAEDFTADGWFRTGDVGKVDAHGYVHIVGRAKDLVISGGYNVYPKEVESVIDRIDGVVESAVIGIPHPDFGEAVTAVVKVGGDVTEAAVIAFCKSRLANYKVPKRVHFVTDLPRNAMGKVMKNVLREQFGK